ncbi:MAG: hypothetical protein D6698_03970 [Gammaproteobacteria bacterium]|nr:MAG: hypothetical protein D6698_03970 [Gammaproteobacteria bacterium]
MDMDKNFWHDFQALSDLLEVISDTITEDGSTLIIVWSNADTKEGMEEETDLCRNVQLVIQTDVALFNCRSVRAVNMCNKGRIAHVVLPGSEEYHLHSILESGTGGVRGSKPSKEAALSVTG